MVCTRVVCLRASLLLAAFTLAFAGSGCAQRVPLMDPNAAPSACDGIEVQPNLVLGQPTVVSGRIVDNKGVPLRNSAVELRSFLSPTRQSPRQHTQTDRNGNFQLERAEPGTYRLLASPTRDFAQPEFLNCEGKRCRLAIRLERSRTDAGDLACPVR